MVCAGLCNCQLHKRFTVQCPFVRNQRRTPTGKRDNILKGSPLVSVPAVMGMHCSIRRSSRILLVGSALLEKRNSPLGVKDYKKNGPTRGPERELPLLQPVKIQSKWTSRVSICLLSPFSPTIELDERRWWWWCSCGACISFKTIPSSTKNCLQRVGVLLWDQAVLHGESFLEFCNCPCQGLFCSSILL